MHLKDSCVFHEFFATDSTHATESGILSPCCCCSRYFSICFWSCSDKTLYKKNVVAISFQRALGVDSHCTTWLSDRPLCLGDGGVGSWEGQDSLSILSQFYAQFPAPGLISFWFRFLVLPHNIPDLVHSFPFNSVILWFSWSKLSSSYTDKRCQRTFRKKN